MFLAGAPPSLHKYASILSFLTALAAERTPTRGRLSLKAHHHSKGPIKKESGSSTPLLW